MADEWDVFGSDDDDSTNEEDQTSTSTNSNLKIILDKVSDAIATIATQKFIKKNKNKVAFTLQTVLYTLYLYPDFLLLSGSGEKSEK